MSQEMPAVMSYCYNSNITADPHTFTDNSMLRRIGPGIPYSNMWDKKPWEEELEQTIYDLNKNPCKEILLDNKDTCTLTIEEEDMGRRLVKVIIIDPNENVPLEDAVLYMGEEVLTDLTDQELFFELELKALLKTHNSLREGIKDKKASEARDKDVYLEAVRIKDLKMVVLTIAQF